MQTVEVHLGKRSYPIYIGRDLLQSSALISKHAAKGKLMLVSDDVVAPLYASEIKKVLESAGRESSMHVCVSGERAKTIEHWQLLLDNMVNKQFGRDSTLVAVGGGVVGDLTGFAAACYMRGIRVIQVPTTLLSQLDSSVGGKTAVNHAQGKNIIGAFHQPAAVVIDTATLETLDKRNYMAGFAEAVKISLVADADLFVSLETNIDRFLAREHDFLATMIHRCCELKAEIVSVDEFEFGRRALLNLGHTFGHALEKIGDYQQWLHGEAVSLGIAIAMKLSAEIHNLDTSIVDRVISLLDRAGLPVSLPGGINADSLVSAAVGDKKSLAGRIRLVLLTHLGSGTLGDPVESGDLLTLLKRTGLD